MDERYETGRGALLACTLLIGMVLLLATFPSVLAANDPGHDSLYVLLTGDSNIVGNLNISNRLNASNLKFATLLYGDYLDVRANGSIYTPSSRPAIQADTNDLYLDSLANVYIATRAGTTGRVQIGPTTGSGITLNVSGTILQQNVRVCLANGSNCPGGNNTGNVSTVTAGSGLANSGTAADPVLDVNVGTGIEISSDAVRISAAAAGNGLAGGAGSALDVTAGDGITISADQVIINNASVCRTTGVGCPAGATAGIGLTNTSGSGNVSLTNSNVNVSLNTLFVDNTNRRIGIGVNAPAQALTVNGTLNVTNDASSSTGLYAQGTLYGLYAKVNAGSDGFGAYITVPAGNTGAYLFSDAGNTILANTTSGYAIRAYSTNNVAIYANGSASQFALYSAQGKNYFAGDAGFGTTAPNQRLQVNGSVNVSGTSANVNIQDGVLQIAGTTRISNTGVGSFATGTTVNALGICLADGTNCIVSNTNMGGGWRNGTNQVYLANNATNVSVGSNVGSSPTFFVDNTNWLVGIGTSRPGGSLNLVGVSGVTTAAPAILNVTGGVGGSSGGAGLKGGGILVAGGNGGYGSGGGGGVGGIVNITAGVGGTDDTTIGGGGGAMYLSAGDGGLGVISATDGGSIYLTPGVGRGGANGSVIITLGNVGIGTTTPSAKTEIAYSAEVPALLLNKTSGTTWNYIRFGNSTQPSRATGVDSSGKFFIGRYTLTPAYFQDLTIDNSGNVGIGTATPGEELTVQGQTLFGNATATMPSTPSVSHLMTAPTGTAAASLGIWGIGASGAGVRGLSARTSLSAPTAVQSGDILAYLGGHGYNGSVFSGNSDAIISLLAAENFGTGKGTKIAFGTTLNGTTTRLTRMLIDDRGFVGIGTSSPTHTLEVNGSVNISGPGYVYAARFYPGNQSTDYWDHDSAGIRKSGAGYTYISTGVFYVESTSFLRGGIQDDGGLLTLDDDTYVSGNLSVGTSSGGYKIRSTHSATTATAYLDNSKATTAKRILDLDFSGDAVADGGDMYIRFLNQGGEVGSVHSTVTYATFTGSHVGQTEEDSEVWEPGMILVTTGKVLTRQLDKAWVELKLSTEEKDPAAVGVFAFRRFPHEMAGLDRSKPAIDYNALGEGLIYVTDLGGDIAPGDLIVTSNRSGYGMRQDDNLYRSYTVAKANEYVIWADEPINQTIGFKRKLIACTYHTG